MAEAKIRIELDAEGAKRKLERFDEDREKARKKTEKAERRQAQRAKKDRRESRLGAAAGVIVAIKSPKLSAIQKRAEEAGGTIKVASQMITKLSALVSAAEAAGDTVSIIAGALEAGGPLAKAIASPLKEVAGGLKATAVPKTLLEQARITAGAVAPFAAAGIPLDAEQILEVREFAKLQAQNKIEEELRAKKKFGRAVANVIADITGLGG